MGVATEHGHLFLGSIFHGRSQHLPHCLTEKMGQPIISRNFTLMPASIFKELQVKLQSLRRRDITGKKEAIKLLLCQILYKTTCQAILQKLQMYVG